MSASELFTNLATVEDDTTLTFQLKNTDVAYVNTLRRMILTGVETLAFNSKMNELGATTDVKITANTTPMTNEMLADRIGLLPLAVNADTWNAETWKKDQYEFRLSKENTTNTTMPVKAEDIEVFKLGTADEGYVKYPPGNREFFRPDPITGDTCLIAVLKAQQPKQAPQKIEFTARASVGTGTQHIRWSPVSQCSYNYTIDTNAERQQEFFVKWLENTKKLSLDSLNDEPGKKEAMIREFQTMEVQRCYKVNEKGEPNSFDFVVESFGTMPIAKIVERALLNIEKKCSKYAGELPNDVKVLPADARMKGFDFYFPNEEHTLGNLFQAYMEANLMNVNKVSYVGYKVPHPLRAEMVLRIGVDFPTDKARDGKQTVARAAISEAAAGCAIMFRQWREEWMRAISGPIGTRNRESLRLNVGNAKALEEAAARVAPAAVAAAVRGERRPQASAFYGKLGDRVVPPPPATPPPAAFAYPVYGGPGAGAGAAAAAAPSVSSPSLPAGWYRSIDQTTGRYYYVTDSGQSQWEVPTAPAAPAAYAPTSPVPAGAAAAGPATPNYGAYPGAASPNYAAAASPNYGGPKTPQF